MEIEYGEGGASRELCKAQEWQDCCFEDIGSSKAVMELGRRRSSATLGNGDCDSCYRKWWRDVRSGCTHRYDRRVRRCDSVQWQAEP